MEGANIIFPIFSVRILGLLQPGPLPQLVNLLGESQTSFTHLLMPVRLVRRPVPGPSACFTPLSFCSQTSMQVSHGPTATFTPL